MTERTVAVSEHSEFYHRVRSEDETEGYCGGLKDVETMTELEAIQAGYEPCQSCVWPEQEVNETPADLPEELYTTATPRRCQNYHTDRTCGSLNRDDPDVTEPTESAVRYHGLTPCPFCAVPDYEGPSTTLATDGGTSTTGSDQSPFPFEEGDKVLVRARENGTSGKIVAKFEANCTDISDPSGFGPSAKARFDMPFGVMNSVSIRPYHAEFEVVSDE